MALFIDQNFEKVLPGQGKLKRALETLSDDYVIRLSLVEEKHVADIVIEGAKDFTWLLLSVSDGYPEESDVKHFLRLNSSLEEMGGYPALHQIVLTPAGPDIFSGGSCQFPNITELKNAEFCDHIQANVQEYCVKFGRRSHEKIKKAIFKESFVWQKPSIAHLCNPSNTEPVLENIFLDYKQEVISKLDLLTPEDENEATGFSTRLLNGVAGSGKTLILVNRAVLYSRLHPKKRSLVLVHNNPVMESIKSRIESGKVGGVSGNIDVKTFHSFALSSARRAFKVPTSASFRVIFNANEVEPHVELAISSLGINFPNRISTHQIIEEIDYINENLISDVSTYLDFERVGRGFALSEAERQSLWQVYEDVCKRLSDPKSGYLPSLYIKQLSEILDVNEEFLVYDHILIDEAQFFSPSWFSLIKKSLAQDALLFLSADPNQGFLKARLSWKKSGINVVGRTRKLDVAYRTTYEIMVAAYSLIESYGGKGDDYLTPAFDAMRRGSKPCLVQPQTPQDELRHLANEIGQTIQLGVPREQIMVVNAGKAYASEVKSAIESCSGVETVENLNDKNRTKAGSESKIKLLSLNSCTGMEAGVVFVVGLGDLVGQMTSLRNNELEQTGAQESIYRLLFVAMTRACEKLIMFSTQELPKEVYPYIEKR